jgi:hypothetical protein
MQYLYGFGFETPHQPSPDSSAGWDQKDSGAVLIEADTAGAALAWGRAVAEAFIKWLYDNPDVSWAAGEYADYIEADPTTRFTADQLRNVVAVRAGVMPDLARVATGSRP